MKPEVTLIQSVTIKRDPYNVLNKNKKIDQVFNDEEGEDDKDAKYYAIKVKDATFKKPDYNNMQMISILDSTCVNDIYDNLKKNEELSDKGDGIQLFKITGNVDNNFILKFTQESRDIAPDQGNDEPIEFYYEAKVLKDNLGNKDKEEENTRGVIKSFTIKKAPNNKLNKEKNIQQLIEEASKIDKDDEQNDEKNAYYYYIEVLGDGKDVKPDELNIKQVTQGTKIKDIYNLIKVKGSVSDRPDEDYGIQIFKVSGDVNIDDLVEHIKKTSKMLKDI